ncbi:MAG: amidohydrolase family protein [Actinobacteria bacterium]|nr:amidohydrolase family protein [Actinomycetota bacterium]
MDKIYNEIFDYIKKLEIIDTHDHLPSFEADRERDTDVLKEYLSHYFSCDLISAGFSINDYKKIIESKLPIMEKWKLVEPYWEVSKYTGYGRSLEIAAKEIYGIDGISKSTIEELNDKFLGSLAPGHFKKVLKDRSKIKISLLDVNVLNKEYNILLDEKSIYCDQNFFRAVYNIGSIVFPLTWDSIIKMENDSDMKIASFNDYLEATETIISKAYKLGAVGLKNALAYTRALKYERVEKSDAEKEFNNIFKNKHFPEWVGRPVYLGKKFQDYMMHHIMNIANKKGLIIQIHTGLQEGNGNIITNSNPTLLTSLFIDYPDVRFDLFHIGYPYQNEITVLAKNFPNVYIDMCWAHIISPNASVNALLEWIDTVPLNKISAFGGDYLFVDGVFGHQYLARENVTKALSKKVSENLFDIDKAKEISKMFFYDNPIKIFRLNGKI